MVTIHGQMIGVDKDGAFIFEYDGVYSDSKPTETGVNSLFNELDTGDKYYFDGETWSKVGGEAKDEK